MQTGVICIYVACRQIRSPKRFATAPRRAQSQALAKTEKTSANRVLVELIEVGLASKEAEKERFFALASRLSESPDPAEREKLKKELARMTFGT